MSSDAALLQRANKAVGKRIGAAVVDFILCLVALVVAAQNFGSTTTTVRDGMTYRQVSLTGWPFVVYCTLVLAYFTLMEWRLGGTIGKLLLRVRVVDAGGGRINLQKALVRNLLRIVDGFPFIFPYLVGLVVIASSAGKQRVGDKVAKTLIVDRQQLVEQVPEAVGSDIPHQ
jgi:uncharacterized RDD family membrane protein YckC